MDNFDSFVRLMLGRPRSKVRPPECGPFAIPVVGESYCQEALDRICGGRTEAGVEKECEAELVPEDDNRYDRHAVRVEIEGRMVGHLAMHDAKDFRKRYASKPYRCRAVIRGGWDRGSDDQGMFGVRLDLELEG